MKQFVKKTVVLMLVLAMGVMALSGCTTEGNKTDDQTVAAVFEGEQITLDEVKLYAYLIQYDVENSNYEYINQNASDADTFWSASSDGESNWTLMLDNTMQYIYQTKVLVKMAKAEGVELTEDEKAKVSETIENFKTGRQEIIEFAEANDEVIEDYITENAIANKYCEKIYADVDTTFDEYEFRMKSGECISVVPFKYHVDEAILNGELSDEELATVEANEDDPFSSEEMVENRKKITDEVLALFAGGYTSEEIAAQYVTCDVCSVTKVAYVYAGTSYAIAEDEVPKTWRQLLFSQSTGDIGAVDYEDSDGDITTYVVKCIDDDDAELRADEEADELEERKAAMFEERIQELYKKYGAFETFSSVDTIEYKGKLSSLVY